MNKLCTDYDVCILCEHWLRPGELSHVRDLFNEKHIWSYFKSSMNPEEVRKGRPQGGVAFVCRHNTGLSYRVLDINCDRLCAIQGISEQCVIFTIVGVYMPFYDGSTEHTELYVETLDLLQDFLDTKLNAECSPTVIMGDFNVSLPQAQQLGNNWYKVRPFNQHSLLLYDFLCNNELLVSNFSFKQNVNYTYFKG